MPRRTRRDGRARPRARARRRGGGARDHGGGPQRAALPGRRAGGDPARRAGPHGRRADHGRVATPARVRAARARRDVPRDRGRAARALRGGGERRGVRRSDARRAGAGDRGLQPASPPRRDVGRAPRRTALAVARRDRRRQWCLDRQRRQRPRVGRLVRRRLARAPHARAGPSRRPRPARRAAAGGADPARRPLRRVVARGGARRRACCAIRSRTCSLSSQRCAGSARARRRRRSRCWRTWSATRRLCWPPTSAGSAMLRRLDAVLAGAPADRRPRAGGARACAPRRGALRRRARPPVQGAVQRAARRPPRSSRAAGRWAPRASTAIRLAAITASCSAATSASGRSRRRRSSVSTTAGPPTQGGCRPPRSRPPTSRCCRPTRRAPPGWRSSSASPATRATSTRSGNATSG